METNIRGRSMLLCGMFVFNLEGLKIVVDEAVIDILTPKKHTVKHTHMREHTHKINRITMYKLLFEYVRNILNVQKKSPFLSESI